MCKLNQQAPGTPPMGATPVQPGQGPATDPLASGGATTPSPGAAAQNRGNSPRPEANHPREQIEDVAASFYVGRSTLSTERLLSGACWSI